MSRVRKKFDIFYFNAVNNEESNTVEVEIEIEDQCPHCRKEKALIPVTGATPVNEFATYYHFYDSYAITTCKFCSVNVLHYIRFQKEGMDLHFTEEKVYSPQSPKTALLESLKERYPTTMELYKQAETAEENELYYLEGVAYIKALEDLIENYLAIKNSNRNELDITDYSKIDIEEKIRMIENKNNKKVIPNEFISKIKSISEQRDNRLYQITEEDLVFIKNMITVFLAEIVEEVL
ncbi:hypothetical protein [Aerococcus viridans]|uniref:hypothetical protein n=1 Tax=Aerococcus viridans TaxID=1377 RepID=UPI0002DA6F57|nr:hypothetical protein [Aerococcus viridans]